jgi:hypothetical protein
MVFGGCAILCGLFGIIWAIFGFYMEFQVPKSNKNCIPRIIV